MPSTYLSSPAPPSLPHINSQSLPCVRFSAIYHTYPLLPVGEAVEGNVVEPAKLGTPVCAETMFVRIQVYADK